VERYLISLHKVLQKEPAEPTNLNRWMEKLGKVLTLFKGGDVMNSHGVVGLIGFFNKLI
jgi:hypothetical protein